MEPPSTSHQIPDKTYGTVRHLEWKEPLERDIGLDKLRRNEHAIPLVTSPKASGQKINLSTSLNRMKNHVAVGTDEMRGAFHRRCLQLLLKRCFFFLK
jgi:hypothetical protein